MPNDTDAHIELNETYAAHNCQQDWGEATGRLRLVAENTEPRDRG